MKVERGAIQIYFDDLKEEAQEALLEFYEVDDPESMNWDQFPVLTLPLPEGSP